MNYLFYFVPVASMIALFFAWLFYHQMKKENEGTPTMKEIAQYVREGAMAYLKQQYKVVGIVFVILAVLFSILAFGFGVQNKWVPFAFLTGGFFSALAGYVGMRTATYASARTANAVSKSLNSGLKLAFRSGAVMGLTVVGLGLLDISIWWVILNAFVHEASESQTLVVITTTMLTFGMGASTQALFARVGGGIYTKAADVGADIVGKVEQDIPEDDPRNPATIADNVGDNVGDVAGMGADLYESYCGSVLATMALGASAFFGDVDAQMRAIIAPMMIAAIGVVLSIIGIYAVRTKEGAGLQQLLKSLSIGTNLSACLIAVLTFAVFYVLGFSNWWQLSLSVIAGLLSGVIIGKATEYYTSHSYKPTQDLAESSQTGPATVIINGIGLGMISTCIPVVTIVAAILISYLCATGFSFDPAYISNGLYGISIAAVGMLSTLGITLATDAYGPIADNAGGNAQMSELDPEVRRRTDTLDALGNTTAATGKGFAIGSAALTALALFSAYAHTVGLKAIDLLNPVTLIGLFIGATLPFVFGAMTMESVGKAAYQMIEEVRRQFHEIPGLLEGKAKADYQKCVDISTAAALHEMIMPGVIAIVAPLLVGFLFGTEALGGLIGGSLASGVLVAILMANAGGAWDNAKKFVEASGRKHTPVHDATVVGDTVGDPFKDTSGPAMNILIKLMTIVSLVFAPVLAANGGILLGLFK